MAERKFWVKISGTPLSTNGQPTDHYRYSGRMGCNFLYITSDANYNFSGQKENYEHFFEDSAFLNPIIFNYIASTNSTYDINKSYLGLCNAADGSSGGVQASFYRREYDIYQKKQWDDTTHSVKTTKYEFVGPWEPVMINTQSGFFRDFNVRSGHSYQYVMYPSTTLQKQIFAKNRSNQNIYSIDDNSLIKGDAIHVDWSEWSISELIEEENTLENAPILSKIYKVDLDNIWLFKYSLDVGSQKQQVTKNQVNTLGQYPRIAHGNQNSLSGSVSCLLGSEIVPYSKDGYIERMWRSIYQPLSTNERVLMLQKWRQLVYSKNPKLLKDAKGQSWIVSIIDNSNTPYNSYRNQPDKISFSWVEIESTDNVIIYGDSDEVTRCGGASSIWESITK